MTEFEGLPQSREELIEKIYESERGGKKFPRGS